MPRREPSTEDNRLHEAALELFLEREYENVTVAEITERAGLTRRPFSRCFTDKRDVLFAGSEQLPVALAHAVRHAGDSLSPFEALLTALVDVAVGLADRGPLTARRRAVVQTSPELQERVRRSDERGDGGIAGPRCHCIGVDAARARRCRHLPYGVGALSRRSGAHRPTGPHP